MRQLFDMTLRFVAVAAIPLALYLGVSNTSRLAAVIYLFSGVVSFVVLWGLADVAEAVFVLYDKLVLGKEPKQKKKS